MLTKRQITDLSKRHSFFLKKSLGQSFLIDKNVRDKVINLFELKKDDTVLEIGSGLGALTEELAKGCRYIYAVEKDKKIYNLSKEHLSSYGNLEIIHCDFLKFDIDSLPAGKIKVIGALPYYITSPIIQRLIAFRKKVDTIFVMVQKEVAGRMIAMPGRGEYSAFTLFIRFYADVKVMTNIKKGSFFPEPKVDSCLVRFKILREPPVSVKDEEMLFKVIRTAFSQRRKTLLTTLSQKSRLGLSKDDLARLFGTLNIDVKVRPESLGLEQFAEIADAIVDNLR